MKPEVAKNQARNKKREGEGGATESDCRPSIRLKYEVDQYPRSGLPAPVRHVEMRPFGDVIFIQRYRLPSILGCEAHEAEKESFGRRNLDVIAQCVSSVSKAHPHGEGSETDRASDLAEASP